MWSLLGLIVVVGQEDGLSHCIALLLIGGLIWIRKVSTWRSLLIGVLLIVNGLRLHIVALLICRILLSIVDVPWWIISCAHCCGINGVHGLGEHEIGASSPTKKTEDNKEDDGTDDGGDGIIDPWVVVVEVVAVVWWYKKLVTVAGGAVVIEVTTVVDAVAGARVTQFVLLNWLVLIICDYL